MERNFENKLDLNGLTCDGVRLARLFTMLGLPSVSNVKIFGR